MMNDLHDLAAKNETITANYDRQTNDAISLWIAPFHSNMSSYSPNDSLVVLSQGEIERYHSLRIASDKRSYLASHIFLRNVLSHVTNHEISPEDWQFNVTENEKPFVASQQLKRLSKPTLQFSLSRTRHLTVVAVSFDVCAGVDVESFDFMTNGHSIDAALTQNEKIYLDSRSSQTKSLEALKIWTAKEAYTKTLGLGVSLDFATIEIALDPMHLTIPGTSTINPKEIYFYSRILHFRQSTYFLTLASRKTTQSYSDCEVPNVTEHIVDDSWTTTHIDKKERGFYGRMETTLT